MSPPIRDGSGDSIGSIRLGDGTEISEVRTGAGDVLFSAAIPIPASDLLQNRYDARELSLSDGDTIDPLTDLEGNTDLAATSGPFLDADAINSNAASFYGSDDSHSGTFPSSISQPFVVAFALRVRSVDSGENKYYFEDPAEGPRILSNLGEWQIADSTGSFNGGSVSQGNYVVVGVFDGANSELRVNGAQETTADLSDSLTGLRFGEAGAGANYAAVSVGAEFTYDGLPTISDVESYLSDEFDIAI